jgi:DNA-3-methyladenine glycosylase I
MSARPAPRSVVRHADGRWRCAWCGEDPLYVEYHDREWGVPSHEDRHLFEMLCLEGAQAGLAWITVLRKRESYRKAFDGFDAREIARYSPARIERLLRNPGIVRNRLKIESVVRNARAFLEIADAGCFADLVWRFAPPAGRRRKRYLTEIPASTPESDALSKELKRRGFNFVGSTIVYAFMQSVGIVDDHLQRCWAAGRRAG